MENKITSTKLNSTSPKLDERNKSALEKTKDWAYTANHAIFCLITDIPDIFGRWWLNDFESGQKFSDAVVNPFRKYTGLDYIGKKKEELLERPVFAKPREWLDKKLGKLTEEERDDRAIDKFFNKNKYTTLLREFVAELLGDSAAVPFTVALQRITPRFMNALNKAGEKLQGKMYRKSTMREAIHWGKKNGFEPHSEEVKEKQKELYEYEIGHLAQAYMWTVSSMFFNAGFSKVFGNKSNYGRLVANNVISATSTFALVTAGRVKFPEQATKADAWTKRVFIDPIFGKDKLKQENSSSEPKGMLAQSQQSANNTDSKFEQSQAISYEKSKKDWQDKTETAEVRRSSNQTQEASLI